MEAAEEQVRTLTEPRGTEPEAPAKPLEAPVIRATLDALREEDPAQYEAALVRLAQEGARKELAPQIEELKDSMRDDAASRKVQDQAKQVQQGIHNSLATIKSEWGGVYSEVVDDFYSRQQESLLYKRMQENPFAFVTKTGVQDAVAGLVAELRIAQKNKGTPQQSVGNPVVPSVEASAGGGEASTRGVSLGDKPEKKSEEEEWRDAITGASRPGDRLGFL